MASQPLIDGFTGKPVFPGPIYYEAWKFLRSYPGITEEVCEWYEERNGERSKRSFGIKIVIFSLKLERKFIENWLHRNNLVVEKFVSYLCRR